jgi:hypothetical protein
MVRPTKSVPGGCVLGLFALGAFAYGALALVAAWKLSTRHPDHSQLPFLLISGIASLLLGLVLLVIGLRLALRIPRSYDPCDPDEPRMKF